MDWFVVIAVWLAALTVAVVVMLCARRTETRVERTEREIGNILMALSSQAVASAAQNDMLERNMRAEEERAERLRAQMEQRLEGMARQSSGQQQLIETRVDAMQKDNIARLEVMLQRMDAQQRALEGRVDAMHKGSEGRLDAMAQQMNAQQQALEQRVDAMQKNSAARLDAMAQQMNAQQQALERRVEAMQKDNAERLEAMLRQLESQRKSLDERMEILRKDNAEKLEAMRATVDEKLQKTLEQRLSQSFTQVSERLEQVYKGLGEMHSLAAGVGDLKKVLTNVKTRGTWGEIQLGSLLEQMLAPGQYERSAQVKRGSAERVDFVVRMPGQEGGEVLLPIDSKFPQENYVRLLAAYEEGDAEKVAAAGKALAEDVKAQARSIRDKYISPPRTTDFAVMYLPVEGLYAEVLRQDGLVEGLQRDCRVTVAGPTTLSALLTSLQMGFRTLAIQKRTNEVWKLLGAVKTDFGRFANMLEKTQRALTTAVNSIDDATKRTRSIEQRLKDVEKLPENEAQEVLGEGGEEMDG